MLKYGLEFIQTKYEEGTAQIRRKPLAKNDEKKVRNRAKKYKFILINC